MTNVERVWVVEDASLENHSPFSTETEIATYFVALSEGSRARYLRPPAPFSGEATYSAQRNRLRGGLAVELLGLPPQRLTGPGCEARVALSR